MSETVNQTPHGRRDYSTFALFEAYWVRGQSLTEMDASISTVSARPIPTRTHEDAKRLADGSVQLPALWEQYLTDFQIEIAQEMRADLLAQRQAGGSDDE